ncbi:hypothetical protein [Tannockella kyphosi]|uniref:hypothetical protein n=1 Tax=Tannockella kyphosi TaxID=2899121 RepID=UPI00201136D0|nr:hypothetical protein [Tannockella kyphosi]
MKNIVILLILVLCTGCQNQGEVTDEEIDFQEDGQVEEYFSYSHGVVDFNLEEWIVEGSTIDFNYYIENLGDACEIGLFFLIDGIPQQVTINNETGYMYNLDYDSGEYVEFEVSIQSIVMEETTEANLQPCVVLNPSTIVTSSTYTFDHLISCTAPVVLNTTNLEYEIIENIETLIPNSREISASEVEELGGEKIWSSVVINQSNNNEVYVSNLPLDLTMYGKAGTYRLLVMEDNTFTGIYTTEMIEQSYCDITIDALLEDTKNISFLMIPLEEFEGSQYTTAFQATRGIVE